MNGMLRLLNPDFGAPPPLPPPHGLSPSLHRNLDKRNGLGVAGAGKRDINLDSSQPIMERECSNIQG